MTRQLRILILEDRPADAELVMRELRKAGIPFTSNCVANEADFLAQLGGSPPDLILADYSLPSYDGLSALAATRKACPETPFIFVSGTLGEETAIEALHRGATDYVFKERLTRLAPAVQRAMCEIEKRTQRRQAQDSLRASDWSYQEMFNATHDAIFVHDAATGTVLAVNQRALEMSGYSREELLNQAGEVFRADGPFSHQEAVRRIRQAVAEGPQVFEWQSKRKNGELLWSEVALRGANIGGQGRVLAVVRDVTERKRVEQVLRQSEEYFRALTENALDLTAVLDPDSTIRYLSPSIQRVLGFTPAELVGRNPFELIHPEDVARTQEVFRAAVATPGGTVQTEFRFGHKDGSWCVLEAITRNLVQDPSVKGVIVNSRDVTARRQAERQIQHLNEVLRAVRQVDELIVHERNPQRLLAEACNILFRTRGYRLVWIARAESGSKRVVPAARAGTGVEFLDHATVTWDESETGRGPVGTALRTRRTCVCQNIATDPAFAPWRETLQAEGYASVAAAPMIHGDRLFGVVAIYGDCPGAFNDEELGLLSELAHDLAFTLQSIEDENERKALEQRLRQAQKMEAVGQLAGGVAHDFNNLLAVIRGNAELLLMDAKLPTPEAEECLKQVTAASERAANLTRQLLAFSRKQVMQSQPLILSDVIADLTKMLKRIIGEHIDMQCRYAAQLPFIRADPGMIEQVLLNLAVNARDAMPRGGQLLITTETASFDAAYARTHPEAAAGEFVCLMVSDTGTGIPPEHLPRIFEPFFTTKEMGHGTGLGLATVYGIVKQHQGWIEVASQLGAGATFKIFLPAIPTPAGTAATPRAEAALPGGSETILLVEDDSPVRMITRRVLENRGYKIYEATNAKEALDLWRSRPEEIALLLTDIVMPQGVTGRDLAEQMSVSNPTLKVILMSGYSADVIDKDTSFFQRTKSYFLQKPCSARTLLETVRACLDAKW
jgi:PAS domain S-box-containing protein